MSTEQKTLGQIAYEKHYEFLDGLLKKHGGFSKYMQLSSQRERDTWEETARAVAAVATKGQAVFLDAALRRLGQNDEEITHLRNVSKQLSDALRSIKEDRGARILVYPSRALMEAALTAYDALADASQPQTSNTPPVGPSDAGSKKESIS